MAKRTGADKALRAKAQKSKFKSVGGPNFIEKNGNINIKESWDKYINNIEKSVSEHDKNQKEYEELFKNNPDVYQKKLD